MATPTAFKSERVDAHGSTLVKLVVQEAAHTAHRLLADRLRFELTPEKWDAFQLALHKPADAKPKLLGLLNEPGLLG